MSLINEALKKAQRQRSLDAAPLSQAPSGIAAAAVTTHVRSASHRRSYAPLWFGLGLVSLGVVATVVVMRYGIDSDAPAKPVLVSAPPAAAPAIRPEAAPVPPASPAAEVSTPMVVLPPIPQAAPAAPVATVTSPATNPAPTPLAGAPVSSVSALPAAGSAATPAPVATVAPVPTPVAPVAAAPLTPAEREAKVYEFLNTLRLTGVRGLDREARILMNERVWRLNDVVSPEFGLRISAVRPNLLVFTDAQGKTYEKPY